MLHPPNAHFWSLVHREYGPVSTFLTFEAVQQAMVDVIRDEPEWADDLSVQPFELRVLKERDA